MSENKALEVDSPNGGGKVTFADDVIAVIAVLAASEVDGIAGMIGGAMSGFTERLGRKNLTKGVKVEVGEEEVAIDVYVIVYHGNKIQDIAASIQNNVKTAIETMTGLRVVAVNVFIQGIELKDDKTTTQDKDGSNSEDAKVSTPLVK